MIDQGSSTCTITASTVIKFGFSIIRYQSELIGWGETENPTLSDGIVYVNIEIDNCVAENICMRIVPDYTQPMPVLIGRTYTDLPHLVYIRIDDKFQFMYKKNFYLNALPQMKSNLPSCSDFTVEKTSIISRETINFIDVKSHGKKYKLPIRKEIISQDDIIVDTCLNETQISELLIILNKYKHCVAFSDYELGCTNLIEMDIIENPNCAPVHSKPYKAKSEQRKVMR